jgi:hypothetical protein
MHLQEDYEHWKQNSLINMKTPEDWRPVWVGLGILAALLGAVFIKYYIEQKKLAGYESEIS